MSRAKKDGRHINYYIDRKLYEELERHAQKKGQTVTTALERILTKYFEQEKQKEASHK